MKDDDIRKLERENKALRLQLKAAVTDSETVRRSRAYRVIRLAGHAKNELQRSPAGFVKKSAKKVLNKTYGKSLSNVGDNLVGLAGIQAQYKQWITFNEPDDVELEQQRKQELAFSKRPLISVITPVFNPPAEVFLELIESLLKQTYTNFELCLGDFGSSPAITKIIQDYAKKDSRIKYYKFTENKGIAANSNQILEKVTGTYVALLDHDDTISPDALYEVVSLLNKGNYDFIYSDKDKIDEEGNRFDPFFKPDWSPEIMLNANYLTHLNVMDTELVRSVGAWNPETDGAQDWDLFLKVTAVSKNIGHIPKVLYHWRVIATSTAFSLETKPYALQGQRNAIDSYLRKNKIPATSYHSGAELLLKWKTTSNPILVIIKSNTVSRLLQLLADINEEQYGQGVKFVIFHDYDIDNDLKGRLKIDLQLQKYNSGDFISAVDEYVSNAAIENILLFNDGLSFDLSLDTIDNLFGWLAITDVKGVSPRIVNTQGRALDCGALLTAKGLKPIFIDAVSYYQSPLGNIEWVRNLRVPGALMLATTKEYLLQAFSDLTQYKDMVMDEELIAAASLAMSKSGRLVLNTKTIVTALPGVDPSVTKIYNDITDVVERLDIHNDPFMNINLSPNDPMQLASILQEASSLRQMLPSAPTDYGIEALAHATTWDASILGIEKNQHETKLLHAQPLKEVKTVLFILPGFSAIYAGLNNIFSYASFLHKNNATIYIAILAEPENLPVMERLILEKFPELSSRMHVIAFDPVNPDAMPQSDIAICTQWATAYCLMNYKKTKRKCYFIQDKEASFYAKGTIAALAENTYGFGFFALANTPGLLEWYRREYNGDGVVVKSTLNLSVFAPSTAIERSKPYRVLFYGRPNEPRNAFELGAAALIRLKEKYGSDVEIYSAGADWDPTDYGLEKTIVNMGKVAYDELPSFYRSMDVGLMFMFSGHPGVVASELMASGCPVVVNQYADKTWNELYENEINSLVAYPTATAVEQCIDRLLKDKVLRKNLISNALSKVRDFYGDYDKSCRDSLETIKKPLR